MGWSCRKWWWPATAVAAGWLAPSVAFASEAPDPADWGLQFGGPGVFEIAVRPRLGSSVLLEVGAFFAAGGGLVGNASLGLVLEIGSKSNVQPYFAFGAGTAGGCGESESGPGCGGLVYGYSRVGLAWDVGPDPPAANLLTIDIGGWAGGNNLDSTHLRPLLIPMAGVGYYW